MKRMRTIFFCITSFFICVSWSCAQNNSLQKKYGNDTLYYLALNSLNEGNQEQAQRLLNEAVKKASPLAARRALEMSASLGTVQERIEKSILLYKTFPDEDSLLAAAKQLFSSKEYARVISLTEGLDLKACPDETAYYRLCSMHKKNDSRFQADFFEWCTVRSFQNFHYQLYCETFSAQEHENWKLLEFRADVYAKSYAAAARNAKAILGKKQFLLPQVLSDAGKSFLYGSPDVLENALYLDSLSNSLPAECVFYTQFYAGRLYDKSGSYGSRARSRFISAMEKAESAEHFDTALWYYLNALLKVSAAQAAAAVETYAPRWHDPLYFDDFFETLSVRLLSLHLWNEFYKTALLADGTASRETAAQFSYISARLIQGGFIQLPKSTDPEEESERLFRRALESGSDLYYRFLSAEKLRLKGHAADQAVFSLGNRTELKADKQAEQFLLGYADFGLCEHINSEYQKLQDKIGMDCTLKIARFLNQCGKEQESIRIASRRIFSPDNDIPRELLELAFPQRFKDSVTSSCRDFSQPEYLLYGLIRSESFFNPEAVSHAGATGLTQLMDGTAADVARKLKVAQYDLKDSATNIRFGSFYLEELRRRLGGSSFLAILSYNAGITRVRSWTKSASLEFATESLPKDLFLEAIPFGETREYGRKVVSAATMYGFLYYGKSPAETVEEIMK